MTLVVVFAPAKAMVITAAAFVGIDLVVGVLAARKRKEPITSNGFRRTLTKLAIYEVALLLAFLADQYLLVELPYMARIVSNFVAVSELKSIYENLNELGGGDILKTLIAKLNGPNDEM
jgi:phage-related holin